MTAMFMYILLQLTYDIGVSVVGALIVLFLSGK